MRSFDLSLYLIIGSELCQGRSVPEIVAAAVTGGVTAVQLREKSGTDRERYALASVLQATIERLNAARPNQIPVLLVLNDRLDLALAVNAGGCHLGQDDLPVAVARYMAPELVLGTSVETQDEARRAWQEGCDYVGTGPIYGTSTKLDAGEPYGPGLIPQIKAAAPLPVVGIGGITAQNAGAVAAAGASGIAVASAIAGADDPAAVARALRRAFLK